MGIICVGNVSQQDGVCKNLGRAAFTVWVDSANGSDANPGRTALLPKQTIAGMTAILTTGDVIGLARGSVWREQFTAPTGTFTIQPYGAGAMPILDGADIATTWTQPDSVTYPNVWSRAWTRTGPITSGVETLGLWADGVRPRFAASLDDLQTNGGWFSTSRTTLSATISIKSATDPNTSGVVYEVAKRNYGIYTYDSVGTTTIHGPIEIKRCVGHYNGLSNGPGTPSKVFIRDGTIHHSVSQAALMEDLVLTELDKNSAPIPLANYRTDGAGFNPVVRRLMALFGASDMRTPTINKNLATIGHSSSTIDSYTVEQSCFDGINGVELSNALASTCSDSYFKNLVSQAINCGATSLVRRLLTFDATTGTFAVTVFDYASATTGAGVTDCAFFGLNGVTGGVGAGTLPVTTSVFITSNGNALNIANSAALSLTYSVLDVEGVGITVASTASYTGDYNVLTEWRNAGIGASDTSIFRSWQTGGAGIKSTLAQWQALSGQDANSVSLRKGDQVSGNALAFWLGMANGTGGPEVGDFRINPVCRVYTGAGVAKTGTFADGTPITLAGPQAHWDFAQRAVVAGPPSRVPTLPASIAEMRTYLENPTAWVFYP